MYYPKEAHAAFDQGLLECESASADLIVLWKRADRIAVMHALDAPQAPQAAEEGLHDRSGAEERLQRGLRR